jgi:SAM-dependent methyltransferase
MSTPVPDPGAPALARIHQFRRTAESFGTDAARYDRARPPYPEELVTRIVAGFPGARVLDIGCGTGIAGRQFQGAGCAVLGVEPDARMAEFALTRGLPVEVATFEEWDPAGRAFDAVIAAQSWHWVDPVAGARKAAHVLRPGGRLAVFGHVYEPPEDIARPFAEAFRRAVPNSPFAGQSAGQSARRPLDLYRQGYRAFGEAMRGTGLFAEPEYWHFDWEQTYTRDQWLDLLPTTGGLTRLEPEVLQPILAAVGSAIDELGGSFTMPYTTLATMAVRDAS